MVAIAETRVVSGEALVDLGREYPNIVVLGGDLNKSTHANKFGAAFPDRFFDFGPAEQNIVGVAAGMAASGKIPFVSTFAVFGSSRPYDQLRVLVSQPRLNVKVLVTHAGIITGEDGVSAQAIEDVAIMRALAGFTVVVPSDTVETVQAIRTAVHTDGPFYIRLSRAATAIIHDDSFPFTLGKAETVRDGDDATIIAYGIMVYAAMQATEKLADSGISCRVLNMATVKPVDETAILKAARETGALVTAEEHLVTGGLGSAVSQVLAQNLPTPVEIVGLHGYAESGRPDELLEKYHLTPGDIEAAVRRVLARKT